MASKIKPNGDWKSHKYYYKLDLPGGGARYFYSKAEYDAYLGEGGSSEQTKSSLAKNTYSSLRNGSSAPRSGYIDSRKGADKMTDGMMVRARKNGVPINMPSVGTSGNREKSTPKTASDYINAGMDWIKNLLGGSNGSSTGTNQTAEKSWIDQTIDEVNDSIDRAKQFVNNLLGTTEEVDDRKKEGTSANRVLGDKKATSVSAKNDFRNSTGKNSGGNKIMDVVKRAIDAIKGGKSSDADESTEEHKNFSLDNVRRADHSEGRVNDAKEDEAWRNNEVRNIKSKIAGEHSVSDDFDTIFSNNEPIRFCTDEDDLLSIVRAAGTFMLRQNGYDVMTRYGSTRFDRADEMLKAMGFTTGTYQEISKSTITDYYGDSVTTRREYHISAYNSLMSYEDFVTNFSLHAYMNDQLKNPNDMMFFGGDTTMTIIVKGEDGLLYNMGNGQQINVMNMTYLLRDMDDDLKMGVMSMDLNDIDWDNMINYIQKAK